MQSLQCPNCTFLNHPEITFCEMCDASLSSQHQETSQSRPKPPQDSLQRLQRIEVENNVPKSLSTKVLLDSAPCPPQKLLCSSNDIRDVVVDNISDRLPIEVLDLLDDTTSLSSRPQQPPQQLTVSSKSNESDAYTQGLIELMSTALREENARFRLCTPCYHVTQAGFEGSKWACGFRNLQMLSLSLIQRLEYKQAMFNGTGDIPDVHGLQSWIEKAWADGFDPVGCFELDGNLLGTTKWIGSSDCATLLRYFGVRAHVVEFATVRTYELLKAKNKRQRVESNVGASSDAINRRQVTAPTTDADGWEIFSVDVVNVAADDHVSVPDGEFMDSATVGGNNEADCNLAYSKSSSYSSSNTSSSSSNSSSSRTLDTSYRSSASASASGTGPHPAKPAMKTLPKRSTVRPSYFGSYVNSGDVDELLFDEDDDDDDFYELGSVRAILNSQLQGKRQRSNQKKEKLEKEKQTNELGDRVGRWIVKYFNSKSNFIPPIYLQHEGHSRTVVGYELDQQSRVHLLFFDPMENGKILKRQLLQSIEFHTKEWKKRIKRGLHTLKNTGYEILFVQPGIMSEVERLQAKILTATSENDEILSFPNM